MTEEQYKEYNRLRGKLDNINSKLSALKETSCDGTPAIKIGWLNLSYGNGSWNKPVLSGEVDMAIITDLIEVLLNKEKEDIELKMKYL